MVEVQAIYNTKCENTSMLRIVEWKNWWYFNDIWNNIYAILGGTICILFITLGENDAQRWFKHQTILNGSL